MNKLELLKHIKLDYGIKLMILSILNFFIYLFLEPTTIFWLANFI